VIGIPDLASLTRDCWTSVQRVGRLAVRRMCMPSSHLDRGVNVGASIEDLPAFASRRETDTELIAQDRAAHYPGHEEPEHHGKKHDFLQEKTCS
jgi:hypothetical protein